MITTGSSGFTTQQANEMPKLRPTPAQKADALAEAAALAAEAKSAHKKAAEDAWLRLPEFNRENMPQPAPTGRTTNGSPLETPPAEPKPPRLQPLDLKQFFELKIKPREMLLKPIVPEKGLVMLYASRGTGKTLIALGIACAVATGTTFLKWTAPKRRRVLLIDGEMPAADLQTRLASMVAGVTDAAPDDGALNILCGDLIELGGIGNLASTEVQVELDRWLDGIDLLILDNLSSLTAVIRDNDAESWGPIQEWLLRLRRRGISVLIVHHAGKGGQHHLR